MSGSLPAGRASGPAGAAAGVRSIAPPSATFVSPSAVRRAVAGYAAEQGWAPGMTAGAVREGTGLTLAAAALALQMPGSAGAAPWARAVPTCYDALQSLTGLDRSGVRSALEVLAAAGVLRTGQDDAGLTLTFGDATLWAPHPLLGAAPWSLVALALARADAPVRAALVVFAELGLETELACRAQVPAGMTADERPADVPLPVVWLELTLKELAHRVRYHLSHVENALTGLEDAGCLTRMRGATGRALRLAPWTLGAAAPPAVLLRGAVEAPAPGQASESLDALTAPAGAGVVVEFHGTRVVLAPGDTVDLSERDADGRRVLRVQGNGGDVVIRSSSPSKKRD